VIPTPTPRRRARRILQVATALATVLAGALASSPECTGASLRLTDGRVLEGREVRRDGDTFLLVLDGDTVVPVPVELVEEVGIDAAPEAAPPPDAVPGLTYGEPQTLAGAPVTPPTTEGQLAVLGKPAQFQQNVVTSGFPPKYWVPDPAQNNFNPSKWAQQPTDPNWQPKSAYDPGKDVLADGRSTWQKAPTDPTWVPQDGFKKKPW
jgi:hypothetical protein